MAELSTKKYWNVRWRPGTRRGSLAGRVKALERKLVRQGLFEYTRRYSDYLLWEVIYPRYMPRSPGAKVLEIGSAPGSYLVRLSQRFGYVPYGVEYSESGVERNRQKFLAHQIDPDNVLHADFLADAFHDQYRGRFDIVVSRGFIEHFSNVGDVIDKHLNVLAPGGRLFVHIPNFRKLNYLLMWTFHRELLAMHNLDIMPKDAFAGLFDAARLERLFCGYYGTFDFGLFDTAPRSLLRPLLLGGKGLQLPLNVALRSLFGDRGRETAACSPYLLYVGIKKDGV